MYLAAYSLQVLKLKFSTELSSIPCVLHVWTIYILFTLTMFCDISQIMKLPSEQFPGLILLKESVNAKVVSRIPNRRIWDFFFFGYMRTVKWWGKYIKFTANKFYFLFWNLRLSLNAARIHRHTNIHSTATTRDAACQPRVHDNSSTCRCGGKLYWSVHNFSFPCLQKKRYK
jgi:hypothetical protein